MNVLLALAHSIEEYDQLRLLHSIGADVASIGGYIDPAMPHDSKRPALPDVPCVAVVKEAVDGLGQPDNLRAAQERIPDAILDWADVIVYHHNLDRLFGQWDRLERWKRAKSHRRVIWRTVGQSVDGNEYTAQQFRRRGLEIVRYSPKERNIPNFAGEDALIRFYKDPAEWQGWTGEVETVLNITQHDATPHGRDVWVNWGFWEQATKGLPATFAGPNSEKVGGLGTLTLDEMKAWLRKARVYLYTGTQPASYTLGLIEAMMTGIPVVSIGPEHMRIFPYGPAMFEGHEIAGSWGDVAETRQILDMLLATPDWLTSASADVRKRAIELFGMDTIAAQWATYLDVKVNAAVHRIEARPRLLGSPTREAGNPTGRDGSTGIVA